MVAFIGAGWVFGVLDSRIPQPGSASVFWAGNLAPPWLVLSFMAGWALDPRRWALGAGAATCTAAMIDFFGPGGGWGPVSRVKDLGDLVPQIGVDLRGASPAADAATATYAV